MGASGGFTWLKVHSSGRPMNRLTFSWRTLRKTFRFIYIKPYLKPTFSCAVLWSGRFGGLEVSVLASDTQVRGFKPGRSSRIFRFKKILSTPSFGGEVKSSFPCRNLRHVKEPKSDVEFATFGKILGKFLALPLLGFARIVSDVGDAWWRELERSNHWSSRLGGLTCRWQRHC